MVREKVFLGEEPKPFQQTFLPGRGFHIMSLVFKEHVNGMFKIKVLLSYFAHKNEIKLINDYFKNWLTHAKMKTILL